MSKLAIRHGLSEANNRDNIGTPAFGNPQAGLMSEGRRQARGIPGELLERFGIVVGREITVATSTLKRTPETAEEAGFTRYNQYSQLDEIERNALREEGITREILREMLLANIVPRAAITAAEVTLENPPVEDIWFTHKLRIIGLSSVLGIYPEQLGVGFCEIRELPI